jgi:ATP-dependent phosphofructokinase / diphosphate-dependent phosphofructokinase
MPLKGNALIGQSGGPTSVINASLVGAVQAASKSDLIEGFYGALNGITGIINEQMIDLFREDDEVIEQLKTTPSSALGTCRLKPKTPDLERCMEVFKAHNIRYFFYNGGNDSQLTCHLISELAKSSDWDMHVIGIPKTIDNDLVVTDNCPGFGSAARFAAASIQFVAKDAEAFGNVEVVEVMGRHAGWLTGATQVGRLDDYMAPHLVYLPEVKVNPDEFLEDCKKAYDAHGYLVVAVSEGFGFADSDLATTSQKVDEFGHARLGGIAQALGDMIEEEIGVRARNDKLGNLHRCFSYCLSQPDLDQAYAVGANAVARACNGETDVMITIERKSSEPYVFETETTSLMSVADQTKVVPLEWLNERQNGVTQAFVDYCKPLLQGFEGPVSSALPHYPRLRKLMTERKLQPYARTK